MRYFTCLLVALCISASITHAADQPKLTPGEQEVLNVSKARMQASNRRNPVAWSRFVAEDCIFSDENGVLHTRAQPLEVISKLPSEYEHSENPRDYVVHVYGNTAVLNYRATVHEQFTDSDIVSEMRMTETYIKPNGSPGSSLPGSGSGSP